MLYHVPAVLYMYAMSPAGADEYGCPYRHRSLAPPATSVPSAQTQPSPVLVRPIINLLSLPFSNVSAAWSASLCTDAIVPPSFAHSSSAFAREIP